MMAWHGMDFVEKYSEFTFANKQLDDEYCQQNDCKLSI